MILVSVEQSNVNDFYSEWMIRCSPLSFFQNSGHEDPKQVKSARPVPWHGLNIVRPKGPTGPNHIAQGRDFVVCPG